MLVFKISINLFDLQSILILIFADMQYQDNGIYNPAEMILKTAAIINPIAVACFCEATCYDIFEHFLAAGSKNRRFLSLISTYFNTIKINGQEILYLHYLVWVCDAFHISKLWNQLQTESEYAICVVEFINCIIRCSIVLKDKTQAL